MNPRSEKTPRVERFRLVVKNLVLGLVLSLALGNSPAFAAGGWDGAAKSVPSKMTFRDGNLAAVVVATPLHEVMAEISRLTGAEVRWLSQYGSERISFTFTGVPLHEALARILKQDFMLSYAPSGILTEIWILTRGSGEASAAGLLAAAAIDHPIVVDEDRAEPPTGRNQPRARRDPAAGIREVPVDSSAGIDIAKQPLPVRLEAVELLAMHADTDAAAKEILSHVASTDGDPRVREIASLALLGLR